MPISLKKSENFTPRANKTVTSTTMDSVPPELASALLQWVNSFEEVHKPVSSWRELEDGEILWKILGMFSLKDY